MNQIVGKRADGTPFVALVLEPGNLHRLKRDQPISLRMEDLFINGIPQRLELIIGYSETPVSDARELRKNTEVALDERTAVSQTKRPHCPECESVIEQLGLMRNDSPVALVYCPNCGCVLGTLPGEGVEVS